MKNGLIIHLLVLLLGGACMSVPKAAAAQSRGLFVEPTVQTTRLLGERALLVGGRVGTGRAEGVSFDVGLDLLLQSVSRNPGPFFGDEISSLGRLSGGLRYDVGARLSAGLFSGTFCGGTDSCVGGTPGLYLGVAPEGAGQVVFFRPIRRSGQCRVRPPPLPHRSRDACSDGRGRRAVVPLTVGPHVLQDGERSFEAPTGLSPQQGDYGSSTSRRIHLNAQNAFPEDERPTSGLGTP